MRECWPPQSCLFNFIYAIGFAISFGIIRFSEDYTNQCPNSALVLAILAMSFCLLGAIMIFIFQVVIFNANLITIMKSRRVYSEQKKIEICNQQLMVKLPPFFPLYCTAFAFLIIINKIKACGQLYTLIIIYLISTGMCLIYSIFDEFYAWKDLKNYLEDRNKLFNS